MKQEAKKTDLELKEFGQVMALALWVLTVLLWLFGKSWWYWPACIAVPFVVLAYTIPQFLRPVEKGWMAFAFVLSIVMTRILLTLTFYLAVTPMAFLVRLLGKDLLSLKWNKDSNSYWVEVDAEGPSSRPRLPY